MKKILSVALVLMLCLSLFTACGSKAADSDLQYVKDKGKLVIGVTVYEPMNYYDENGEWTGFDTDLAIAVCEKLGVEAEFVEIVWDTKEAELDAKSIDCIWNGFTIDPDKEKLLDYSMAYMKNAQVVIVKGDDITSIDELNTVKNQFVAGDTVTLIIYRSGKYYEADIVLMDQNDAD